jgi:hypothetical protein
VEEFDGADGRLRFVTTEALLQRFGLANCSTPDFFRDRLRA